MTYFCASSRASFWYLNRDVARRLASLTFRVPINLVYNQINCKPQNNENSGFILDFIFKYTEYLLRFYITKIPSFIRIILVEIVLFCIITSISLCILEIYRSSGAGPASAFILSIATIATIYILRKLQLSSKLIEPEVKVDDNSKINNDNKFDVDDVLNRINDEDSSSSSSSCPSAVEKIIDNRRNLNLIQIGNSHTNRKKVEVVN
jgi:hypothetical protein